ncbi:hypothetical protein LCGC14_0479630 [marine sediment metagenome]|uniref:Uncharacterized protein n=1 Tax=marine sediment metagenome TaxID=412755 RepID=A0A0F9SSW2_9ZZZZ
MSWSAAWIPNVGIPRRAEGKGRGLCAPISLQSPRCHLLGRQAIAALEEKYLAPDKGDGAIR